MRLIVRRCEPPDQRGRRTAVEVRHLDVHEDHVELVARCHPHCLRAVAHDLHSAPKTLQHRRGDDLIHAIVVREQHAQPRVLQRFLTARSRNRRPLDDGDLAVGMFPDWARGAAGEHVAPDDGRAAALRPRTFDDRGQRARETRGAERLRQHRIAPGLAEPIRVHDASATGGHEEPRTGHGRLRPHASGEGLCLLADRLPVDQRDLHGIPLSRGAAEMAHRLFGRGGRLDAHAPAAQPLARQAHVAGRAVHEQRAGAGQCGGSERDLTVCGRTKRHPELEGGTLALDALHLELPAHQRHELLRHAQAQSAALQATHEVRVRRQQALHRLGLHAHAIVTDADAEVHARSFARAVGGDDHPPTRRESDRVAHEVDQHLPEAAGVTDHPHRRALADPGFEHGLLCAGLRQRQFGHIRDRDPEVERGFVELQ